MPDFLLELGVEELPAGYAEPALRDGLVAPLRARLNEVGLSCEKIEYTWTPRRMTLHIPGLPERQPDREEEVWGPAAAAGLKGDDLTPAGEGFARKYGLSRAQIEIRPKAKGKQTVDTLCARIAVPGRAAGEILAQFVPEAIRALRFPKSMVWVSEHESFARPVRSICALLGESVVPCSAFGLSSDRVVFGHPFLAPGGLALENADLARYRELLRERFVIVDPQERRDLIRREIERASSAIGACIAHDEALIAQVADLVEQPGVVVGAFDARFLDLPEEVLEVTMKKHQRYFPLRDQGGKLVNRFCAVMNRAQDPDGRIRKGNERVLAARLSDARFFYDEDRKKPLSEFAKGLSGIVYLHGVGTLAEKAERLALLAPWLCEQAGYSREVGEIACQAARLCKADLCTQMVGEFPEVQGVIGDYYAQTMRFEDHGADFAEAVGQAIREHYQPRFRGDALPRGIPGQALAIADKLDTIVACYALGKPPSGAQDPYGLRRAALGILGIALDAGFPLDLRESLRRSITLLRPGGFALPAVDELTEDGVRMLAWTFILDRLRVLLREDRGYPHDHIEAVFAAFPGGKVAKPALLPARLEALRTLAGRAHWQGLCRLVERTGNIARPLVESLGSPETFDPRDVPAPLAPLLKEPAEHVLFQAFSALKPSFEALASGNDAAGLVEAAVAYHDALHGPVERFFTEVFVNDPNPKIRENRQALCFAVHHLFAGAIADLTAIVFTGEAP